jgi:chromosomal replication initiation ATPase DnaA
MKALSLWKGEVEVPRQIVTTGARTMNEIAALVAAKHGLSVSDLKRQPGTLRQTPRVLSYPRQEAMWLMASQTNSDGSARWSYAMIGGWFGMDHTTIYTGSKAHARRYGLTLLPRVIGGWKFAA